MRKSFIVELTLSPYLASKDGLEGAEEYLVNRCKAIPGARSIRLKYLGQTSEAITRHLVALRYRVTINEED